MEEVWVEQSRFDEGHDIVEAKWVPNGRHVVIVRYAAPLAEADDGDEVNRVVQVCDVEDRATLWSRVCGHTSPVVSPDGILLAHEDRGRHILVRNIVTAKVIREVDYSRFGSRIKRLTWSPDSAHVSVELDRESDNVHVFEARPGSENTSRSSGRFLGWNRTGTHFAVTNEPDDWDEPRDVDIVETQSLRAVRRVELESPEFQWSPDGHKAVVVDLGENPSLRVVSVSRDTKTIIWKMRVAASMWSPDGSRVLVREASGGEGGGPSEYLVLDASTGDSTRFGKSVGAVDAEGSFRSLGMSWSPDARHVALTESWQEPGPSADEWRSKTRVIVIDTTDPSSIEVIPDALSFIWSPDGGRGMACTHFDGMHRAVVGTVGGFEQLLEVEGSEFEIWDAGTRSDMPFRLFAIQDVGRTCLELWDPWNGHRIGSIPFTPDEVGHRQSSVKTVIWSPDGTRLLIQRLNTRIEIWRRDSIGGSPVAPA